MCRTAQQHESFEEALDHIISHRIPKIDCNLAKIGVPRIQVSDFKREGRYMRTVIIGADGQRIGVGIAHRSLDDPDDPVLGLKLSFERALEEYIHGQPSVALGFQTTADGKIVNEQLISI